MPRVVDRSDSWDENARHRALSIHDAGAARKQAGTNSLNTKLASLRGNIISPESQAGVDAAEAGEAPAYASGPTALRIGQARALEGVAQPQAPRMQPNPANVDLANAELQRTNSVREIEARSMQGFTTEAEKYARESFLEKDVNSDWGREFIKERAAMLRTQQQLQGLKPDAVIDGLTVEQWAQQGGYKPGDKDLYFVAASMIEGDRRFNNKHAQPEQREVSGGRAARQQRQREYLQTHFGVETVREAIAVRKQRQAEGKQPPPIISKAMVDSQEEANLHMGELREQANATAYRRDRDAVSDAHWQQNFDRLNRQPQGGSRRRQPTLADLDMLLPRDVQRDAEGKPIPDAEGRSTYVVETEEQRMERYKRALPMFHELYGSQYDDDSAAAVSPQQPASIQWPDTLPDGWASMAPAEQRKLRQQMTAELQGQGAEPDEIKTRLDELEQRRGRWQFRTSQRGNQTIREAFDFDTKQTFPAPATPDDAAKLPPGTLFVAPDGRLKRVPKADQWGTPQ